jgi:hypothetical protein
MVMGDGGGVEQVMGEPGRYLGLGGGASACKGFFYLNGGQHLQRRPFRFSQKGPGDPLQSSQEQGTPHIFPNKGHFRESACNCIGRNFEDLFLEPASVLVKTFFYGGRWEGEYFYPF